ERLLDAIETYRVTICFTAPTSYRAMAARLEGHDVSSLRKCVSAGEPLPAATRALWKQATGIDLIDGIGSTEPLHIFISHTDRRRRPAGRDWPSCARLRRVRPRRAAAAAAARPGGPARGEGTDRLPLSRRHAAARIRPGRLEPDWRRVPRGRGRLVRVSVAAR